MHRGLVAAVLMLAFAPSAFAGGSSMKIGAAEDAAKWGDPVAKMNLARLAGFDTIRMTLQWSSGQTAPDAGELANTRAAADAARMAGIEPIVALYNAASSTTPADDASRAQFVQFAAAAARGLPSVTRFIVGNEPNSNVFWMPQFGLDGSDAAATAYEALLAASYDALKAARPDAVVVGGALAPRGADNPDGTKPTHSPTTFIRDLGAAYRASGRTTPIMDVFDMHVYADNSSLPPSMEHLSSKTIALGDYGKLVSLLGEAFDGTAQAGSTLPVLYGEFGVESIIPAAKAGAYTGTEPAATTKPVDEATQAKYYVEAFKVAYCQPNVVGILVFHVSDERDLARWQSGPYYADDTAKASLPALRDAANAARAGSLTGCPDANAPTATLTAPAAGTVIGPGGVTLSATASDDVGVGRVQFLANGAVVGTDYGAPYSLTWTPATSGSYTLAARAQDAAHNNGTSAGVLVTVDLTPPETTLTQTPSDGQPSSTAAQFAFAASEAATFECSLDGAAFVPCTSPQALGGLAGGQHSFEVRATDVAGNADPTPAAHTWTVVQTAPENDAFAAALALSGSSGSVTGTTAGATKEPGEPAHAGNAGGHSVWYRWTAPCKCFFTFETAGSSFDTLLAVYKGTSVSSLSVVASSDDAGAPTSRVRFKAAAGTTYRIAVDGKNGASGSLVLARRQG